MMILDGKKAASDIKDSLKSIVSHFGSPITLAVIQVGDDPASSVYVRNKEKACEYVGINSKIFKLDENTTTEQLIEFISKLNNDKSINSILVQLPLPKHIDESLALQAIAHQKDVDGFHQVNMGKLVIGDSTPRIVPCTALGIIRLLQLNDISVSGKHCVVVGRSNIVGKPVALQLLENNGTVTICHSKTRDLKSICKQADILVCAIGKPKFFTEDYIKDDAVVIDVGIHRQEDGSLCGDVDFENVKDKTSYITPVPGGVGPMTVACLMENCITTASLADMRD